MNSEKYCVRYCEPIVDILNDTDRSLAMFKQATQIFDNSGVDLTDKQALKSATTTDKLLKAWRDHQRSIEERL